MSKQRLSVVALFTLAFALLFGYVMPVDAFYLEVPKALKDLAARFNSVNANAQMGDQVGALPQADAPMSGSQPSNSPQPVAQQGPMNLQPSDGGSGMQGQPQGQQQPMQQQFGNQQGQQQFDNQQGMPQFDKQSGQFGDQQRPIGDQKFGNEQRDQQGMPQFNTERGQFGNQQGQFKDMRGQEGQHGQFDKQFKQGVKQMDKQMKDFEFMVENGDRRGQPVSDDTRQRFEDGQKMMGDLKNRRGPDDMQNFDMGKFEDTVDSLEGDRRQQMEESRRLAETKRMMKDVERGLSMFKKQVAKMSKQGSKAPASVVEQIGKIEAILAAVKSAKSFEEIEAAGIEDIRELMDGLHEMQGQMEMLSRWPQTLKQLDRELTRLGKEVKKTKGLADKLIKKGIDVSAHYTAFEEAYTKLKSVRDQAVALVSAGNIEEAFELLENDFFGQMEDIWENQRIIQMLSNLGGFTNEFKRGLKEGQQMIKKLAKQKIDTSEFERMYGEIKTLGESILVELKSRDVDFESVMESLQELENMAQSFEDAVRQVLGEREIRPWEGGKRQFDAPQLSKEFDTLIQRPMQPEVAP